MNDNKLFDNWQECLPEVGDRALRTVAFWGPTEDWSDWLHAVR